MLPVNGEEEMGIQEKRNIKLRKLNKIVFLINCLVVKSLKDIKSGTKHVIPKKGME